VLIAGPTASGKSGLALALAREIGGTIINADSMQVYRDLAVITARPSLEEEGQAPHRLYGHVDAAENYSVGRWLADVGPVLDEARASARVPILVGGTGLYFRALTQGLACVPPIPPAIRASIRARLEAEGPAALHVDVVAGVPPTRLLPHDPTRFPRGPDLDHSKTRHIPTKHR
jgi:tRNA dimethylallyltransferase